MAKVGEAPEGMRGAQGVDERSVAGVSERASVGRRVWDFLRGPYPTLLSRLGLGGIFLLYGLSKLNWPRQFANDIDAYKMGIPPVIVDTMARVLPILEIGLGVWLLVGLFTRFSAAIATVLMSIFTVAITQAWVRGIDANCGCLTTEGGNTEPVSAFAAGVIKSLGPVGDFLSYEQIGPIPVVRDVMFLLMGLHLVFVPTIFALDGLRKRYAQRNVEA